MVRFAFGIATLILAFYALDRVIEMTQHPDKFNACRDAGGSAAFCFTGLKL